MKINRIPHGNNGSRSPTLNGVEVVAGEISGPVFFNLGDPADLGKVSISWAS